MRIKILFSILILFVWDCSPTTKSQSLKTKSSSDDTTNTLLGSEKVSKNTTGTDPKTSSTTATGSKTETNVEPGSDVILDADFLNKMTLNQVTSYYKARIAQLKADKQDYSINDQIGNALCTELKNLRSQCRISNQIIPEVSDTLKCGIETASTSDSASPMSVVLVNSSGSPLATTDGQFVLVANTNYKSDPFGAGETKIRFTYQGGGKVSSPQIRQIYTLELRRADEDVTAIVAGKGKAMPARESFFVQFKYGGAVYADGALLDAKNPVYVGYRYLVPLDMIFTESKTARCRIEQTQLDSIKNQIRSGTISADDLATKREIFAEKFGQPLTKDQMIKAILVAQDQLATLAPVLEDSRNRILRLTGELKTDQLIGCHADEPIKMLSIDLQGKRNDPKEFPDKYLDRCPRLKPTGPSSIISIDMGDSVTVSLDQNKYSIGGSPWVGKVGDMALVGDIEYLRIAKMGIGVEDQGPVCKSEFLAIGSTCAHVCHEIDTFSITGVKVMVDTPSVSGVTIYENKNMNLTFGSTFYAKEAVVAWVADNFRSDQNWIKFMYDTNCDTQK